MCVLKLIGLWRSAMPTELPDNNQKPLTAAATRKLLLNWALNWLAVIVGCGLCIWAIKYGVR